MQRRGSSGQPVKGQSANKPKARNAPTPQVATGDLQEQLNQRTRELEEALQQQTATSEVLSIIRRSPADAHRPRQPDRACHKVVMTWTGTAGIRKRIGDGEVYDLVIVGASVIDTFIQQGKIAPGSRIELMKSAVGVAVRAGAPKPDIGSREAVKNTLLAARSIGYSTGPSGDHVVSLIERFGYSTLANSGHFAPHRSFNLRASFFGHSAVSSSSHLTPQAAHGFPRHHSHPDKTKFIEASFPHTGHFAFLPPLHGDPIA